MDPHGTLILKKSAGTPAEIVFVTENVPAAPNVLVAMGVHAEGSERFVEESTV